MIVGTFEQIETITGDITTATANEFSAKVSSTGVVSAENLDFINGNCSISATSQFTCNFNSSIFTVAPNCSLVLSANTASVANQRTAMVKAITATTLDYSTQLDTTATAQGIQLICQKAPPDFNTSFKGAVINLTNQKVKCQKSSLDWYTWRLEFLKFSYWQEVRSNMASQ
jgi:hypothetical protein